MTIPFIETPSLRATTSEQHALINEHYDGMLALYGRETGVNLFRKHIGWYTKGLPGSAEVITVGQEFVSEGSRVKAIVSGEGA